MHSTSSQTFSRFITGILSTGAGNLVTILSGFVCILIYTRWLPKEEYGSFVLFQIILGLAINTSGFGIDYAITKFISSTEKTQDVHTLINTILNYRLLSLLFAAGIIYFGRLLIEKLIGHSLLLEFLLFLPPLLIIEALTSNVQAMVSGSLNFNLAAIMDAIYSMISLILTALAIIVLGYGTIYLIYIRIICRSISLLFALYHYRFPYKLCIDFSALKNMLRFGFPLYINDFLNYAYSKADSMIIGGFLGPSQIAIYEVAQKIPESLQMLYGAFMRVYFPIVSKFHARGNNDEVNRYLNHTNRLLTFLGLLITLGIIILQKEIVVLLFSQRYIESAPILAMLMFCLVITILDENLGYTLVAIGESSKPPLINFFRAILTLTSYSILIPTSGTLGATYAKALGTAAANPMNVYFLIKKNIQVNWKIYTKVIILFIGLAYTQTLFTLNPFLKVSLFIILFTSLCFLLSIITKHDVTFLYSEVKTYLSRPKKHEVYNENIADN